MHRDISEVIESIHLCQVFSFVLIPAQERRGEERRKSEKRKKERRWDGKGKVKARNLSSFWTSYPYSISLSAHLLSFFFFLCFFFFFYYNYNYNCYCYYCCCYCCYCCCYCCYYCCCYYRCYDYCFILTNVFPSRLLLLCVLSHRRLLCPLERCSCNRMTGQCTHRSSRIYRMICKKEERWQGE